ncbi:MAG TPA: chromate efflux transporter [Solirubrobacteraceae bacterium]|nr:chromate efflux transporter [Solirubrobacteraceae bacterium]
MTRAPVPLATVLRDWGRIGVIGFGGPPAHITLLRSLVVDERGWLDTDEFEAAIAACNLLPGPASTQLAIFCAYRVAGRRGALVGGLAFIVPAVVCVLLLSLLFLSSAPPLWIRGAGDGAGAAVAAVAVSAALALLAPSWHRARGVGTARTGRWLMYTVIGIAGAVALGPYLVIGLLGCGLLELTWEGGLPWRDRLSAAGSPTIPALALASAGIGVAAGGMGALIWEAFKVGALSYGGGFVIIPLMQHDAVSTYHWMSSSHFLNAVALGQITPGPVVATVAAIGYAAHGLAGGVIAAAVAFTPSFAAVMLGGPHFDRVRHSARAQAFLDGAGPAAIGAILGSAVPLAGALRHTWQIPLLAAAAVALLLARRGVVFTLLTAGAIGAVVVLAGAPA